MTFARFMALALYDPKVGYYRRARVRVGYGPGTDFYTAATSGTVFGGLVAESCATLLRQAGLDPSAHTFVEIGAEPGSEGVLAGVDHPFAGARTLRIGDSLSLGGACVVFSNELFDAQPFVRTVFREGRWVELGVRIDGERLQEVELPSGFTTPAAGEGYHLDRPLAAVALGHEIGAQPWTGLFLAFDYGKTWRELAEECPLGTARAYHRHTQTNDLLAHPGEQDITCHVCWDWLTEALRQQGFAEPRLEFQESFFIRHAANFIRDASAADAARFSPRKQSLLQLLHPAHLGQKFQVLHGIRPPA